MNIPIIIWGKYKISESWQTDMVWLNDGKYGNIWTLYTTPYFLCISFICAKY